MGGRAVAGGGVGVIVLALIVMALGGDPTALLEGQGDGGAGAPSAALETTPEEESLKEFVAVVLADTEDVWNQLFQQAGRTYQEPTLVLFRDGVQSACGQASTAVGPFYCGADNNVYLELGFLDQLHASLGAPGDFAQAYVIGHEVGHHVQNLVGTLDKVRGQQAQLSEAAANELSVRLELQADYYAGVWAHHAQKMKQILDEQDIEEALGAASAIGDDRLQMEAQGYVVPDGFTHGTSEQRARWFRKGWETGDMDGGNTFQARTL